MSKIVLEVANLRYVIGGTELFHDLTFTLQSKQMIEVRGPNGSGKTTLLRVIAGILDPVSGTVRRSVDTFAYLGHRNGFSESLTVRENLRWYSGLTDKKTSAGVIESTIYRFGLCGIADEYMHILSSGQARRAAIARLSLSSTKLWILDEPASSLDDDGIVIISELIEEHLESEGSVICATHQPLPIAQKSELHLTT